MKLILGYVETWWIFGCMIDFGWMKKLPHVQLEQHHVDIDLERNRSPTFKFVEVNSGIGEEWDGLPEVPDYPTRRSCKVSVRFDLTAFDFAFVTLCLFREVVDKGLFLQDAVINIFGESYSPTDIYEDAQAVTGFIKGNEHSKVMGCIIDGKFYGSVRFFDPFRLHHVVFYIEPQRNAKIYDGNAAVSPEFNAILFEYVPRINENDPPLVEDYDDTTQVPPVKREIPTKPPKFTPATVAVAGGDSGSSPDDSGPNSQSPPGSPVATSPSTESPQNSPSSAESSPSPSVTSSPEVSSLPTPSESSSDSGKRRKRTLTERPSRQTTNDSNLVWLFGNYDDLNVNHEDTFDGRKSHHKSRRQTQDQSMYSHDNLKADEDIVHSFRFQTGTTKHDMFDTRRQNTYLCELCIWIQPNFAHRFGHGGSVQIGVAEVIDLIGFLNWIFRTQDFDQDGLPENIGFIIKNLYLNDLIRVTKTDTHLPHTGRPQGSDDQSVPNPEYYFSENVNTISTKSALALASKHFQSVFKACCVSVGFIYHNMAPALSTTNLRGLCTSKNMALISGLLHSNKVAKYDVSRALFHAMAHLFGGHHDDVTNLRCHETGMYRFLNPFPLHPIQQLNVGMRSNSFRLSRCSKDHITQFLSSNGIHCLIQLNQTYCGNGIEEDGEECDCGAPWQCHLLDECCGEADTIAGCQITDPYKTQCPRPKLWKK